MAAFRLPTIRLPSQVTRAVQGVYSAALHGNALNDRIYNRAEGYFSNVPSKGLLGAAGISRSQFYGTSAAPGSATFAATAGMFAVSGEGVIDAASVEGARLLGPPAAEAGARLSGYLVPEGGVAAESLGVDASRTFGAGFRTSLPGIGKASGTVVRYGLYGAAIGGAGVLAGYGLSGIGQGIGQVGQGLGQLVYGTNPNAGAGGAGGATGGGTPTSGSGGILGDLTSSPLVIVAVVLVGGYLVLKHQSKSQSKSS